MKKIILVITSAILLFGIIGCDNSSKSSKKESTNQNDKFDKTIDFIQKKIAHLSRDIYAYDVKNKISVTDCNLLIETFTREGNTYTVVKYKVLLSDLNPNKLRRYIKETGPRLSYAYAIQLYTFENKKKIRCSYAYPEEDNKIEKMTTSDFSIYLSSSDDVIRLEKAFKYLIEHCGGKDEMY